MWGIKEISLVLAKKNKNILICFILCFSIITSSSILFESKFEFDTLSQNILIPDISILKLNLHPNATIGSFEKYQTDYPYNDSFFSYHPKTNDISHSSKSCSLLIDNRLYTTEMAEKINQYIKDIESNGYVILSVDTLMGGNPQEVKAWVKSQYHQGVIGVIFIGDIPAAWMEVSGETFPCDLFYMDIDGLWIDNNNDGIYNSHTAGSGDMGPELFVARLFTSTLEWNDEETLLFDYFDKIHQYHSDNLSVPWRGLEYIDEDWYSMNVHLDKIFDNHLNRYDFGYQTTAQDYIQQLQKGHHFVTVCAHSYPGGHHFGRRPTEAATYTHVYVFSPTQRDATLLIGSDDGIIAWLNGEKIIVRDVYTRWLPDQYKIDVTLAEGWNQLLLKISQEGGPYQVSARFTDKQLNTFSDLSYQLNNPEFFGSEGEFVRSWLVNGFHQEDSSSFWDYLTTNYLGADEGTITPFEGESMGGKKWTVISSGDPFIDFDEYSGGADFGVTYGYNTIYAEEDVSCELWVGYDDGMRAWLNSEEIIMDNRYGSYVTDMTKVPVKLHAGENHLVVKVSEWMGSHGFSARFSTSNGEYVEGLSFHPPLEPFSYIGNWLILEPFEHKDKVSRLSMEYITNESTLAPSVGKDAGGRTWHQAIGNGCPFDIGSYFDKGSWVFSETIQDTDPPVLFYNLFACSAGRFTEKNYLAGSYIFNTSYGLVSIASSKTGSMLNFQDFTYPLGIGKSIGESFVDWFNAQDPFIQWEKEWYYGMVLCGDPTLTISSTSDPVVRINIVSPGNSVYLNDNKLFTFFFPLVFGDTTITVDIINPGYGIKEVLFYVNDELQQNIDTYPYTYTIDKFMFGPQSVSVVATDILDNSVTEQITIWKFF
jgi:hypothetical protein